MGTWLRPSQRAGWAEWCRRGMATFDPDATLRYTNADVDSQSEC